MKKIIAKIPTKKKLANVLADLVYEGIDYMEVSLHADGYWYVTYKLLDKESDGWEGDLINQL